MKLKPLLFLAGVAGVVAAVKRRGGAEQLAQAAPQPVRDAAQSAQSAAQSATQSAGATVQRAVQSAPEAVQQAVDKVTPGASAGSDTTQAHERYEPPAAGLAQEPREAGGPPSDATPVTEASPRTPE